MSPLWIISLNILLRTLNILLIEEGNNDKLVAFAYSFLFAFIAFNWDGVIAKVNGASLLMSE